jgi:hypothetical protein
VTEPPAPEEPPAPAGGEPKPVRRTKARSTPAKKPARARRAPAKAAAKPAPAPVQAVVFVLGGDEYALPIGQVQEVNN